MTSELLQTPTSPGGDYISQKELCESLGISRQRLHQRYVKRGEAPEMKQMRATGASRTFIERGAAERFIASVLAQRAARAARKELKQAKFERIGVAA